MTSDPDILVTGEPVSLFPAASNESPRSILIATAICALVGGLGMAGMAKAIKVAKSIAAAGKPSRPAAAAPPAAAKTAKLPAALKPMASSGRANMAPAPKLNKDELRAQVKTLERTVAMLRTRSRCRTVNMETMPT